MNAVEVAKILEDSGMQAIAVHGRTRAQGYSGEANWNVIDAVARAVKIPVIGNGDITCGADLVKRKAETAVSGVMIGRAAMQNPWVFREAKHFLETGHVMQRHIVLRGDTSKNRSTRFLGHQVFLQGNDRLNRKPSRQDGLKRFDPLNMVAHPADPQGMRVKCQFVAPPSTSRTTSMTRACSASVMAMNIGSETQRAKKASAAGKTRPSAKGFQ